MADGSAISAAAKIAGNSLIHSVLIDQGQVSIIDAAVPERPPRFALLQLLLAGICNTDLELQRGYYNFRGTPGHEFVARVADCDNPLLLGKRVVGEINLACHNCDFCSRNLTRHCRNRTVLGILRHPGAFSEYFTLPEENLHIVPDSIPDEHAVFVEPLAAACEILAQLPLPPAAEVAVIGDGKLGLLITQVLLAHNCRVTLYGHHESKLDLARAAGAAATTAAHLPQSTYNWVIECSGSPAGLAAALHSVRPRGTVVLKSTIHSKLELDLAPVIVNEITLLGSRCGPFEPALLLLERDRIHLAPMIAARFPLAAAPKAFETAASRGTLKVLLQGQPD